MARTEDKTGGCWEALVICPDSPMADEIAAFLQQNGSFTQISIRREYPAPAALESWTAARQPRLCFVDVCTEPEAASRLLAAMSAQAAGPPVVALFSKNDPESVLRCLRRGAAGFLLRPFTAQQLQPVLHRIADLRPEARKPAAAGKVYCVIPAKGSCGATTIASNLAFQSKQLGKEKILLADMDPITSTLPFLLKLRTQYSFFDALAHSGDLDRDLWKALVTNCRGVDILTSPESPLDGTVEGKDAGPVIGYARGLYQQVFLDCGSPYGSWNTGLANLSDLVLLVLTSEIPAVYAAQRALSFLSKNGVAPGNIRILVNRYRRDAGLDREEIETALGAEVYQVLPNDHETVESALMEGRPIPGNSAIGRSLAELAGRFDNRARAERSSTSGGVLSFLSR